MLNLNIFDVGAGQCIYVEPATAKYVAYCCTLIDCGSSLDFNPAKKIKFPNKTLWNLTLTNYNEDHFSSICELKRKFTIKNICFPKNLTSMEIRSSKERKTDALECMLEIKEEHKPNPRPLWYNDYFPPLVDLNPLYYKLVFSLDKKDLGDDWTINNLSQMVFIEYREFTMCVPGNLEKEGWEKIIKNGLVQYFLEKTNLFIASHYGWENGYYPEVFNYCKPECIVISDDSIKYGTQEYMSSVYSKHVQGNGIMFKGESRKVLTTRNDGHLLIKIGNKQKVTYQNAPYK